MSALEQGIKRDGNLPLERLSRFLPLDRIPSGRIAGNAVDSVGEFRTLDQCAGTAIAAVHGGQPATSKRAPKRISSPGLSSVPLP